MILLMVFQWEEIRGHAMFMNPVTVLGQNTYVTAGDQGIVLK